MKRAADFRAARTAGKTAHGKLIKVTVAGGAEGGETLFGVVTSRRVGGAVERSRARRLIREVVRHARPQIPPGKLVVVSAKSGAGRAKIEDLSREWLILAARLSILRVSE